MGRDVSAEGACYSCRVVVSFLGRKVVFWFQTCLHRPVNKFLWMSCTTERWSVERVHLGGAAPC